MANLQFIIIYMVIKLEIHLSPILIRRLTNELINGFFLFTAFRRVSIRVTTINLLYDIITWSMSLARLSIESTILLYIMRICDVKIPTTLSNTAILYI